MESVKVLGLNASPRKYGNTYKLLEVALETASMYGAETKLIHLYDYDIKPCEGCLSDEQLACRPPCINDDGSWSVLREILKSDALIIATPVFWYGPSGHLKNLIDKLTVFENMIFIDGKSWVEGKVAGFIAVGAEAGAVMTIAYLMSVFNSFGYLIPPWALAYYQGTDDVLKSREAVMDSANIGKIVVEVAKILKNSSPRKWYEPNILDVLKGKEVLARVASKAENLRKEASSGRLEIVRKLLQEKPDDYRV
ncbi:MAG: flavodoxin family protein [Desulfurococcaceae archaeon]|nr:flavodoxin family protein [Desulfurococcaceae archaeon]